MIVAMLIILLAVRQATSEAMFDRVSEPVGDDDASFYREAESATAKDVEAILELPSGLKMVGGPQTKKTSLAAGKDARWQWSIVAAKPGHYVIRAHSKCATMPGANVDTSISVP